LLLAPLRRKNHSGRKSSGCPDIAVYHPHQAASVARPPNPDAGHRDKSATI
jgi:hypothetical protein